MKNDKLQPSPMMRHYLELKQQYKDAILFYRLGDFYEMFFEDAELVSRELGITLTGKDCGLEHRAPMCGVPFHAYETYAAKLLNKGYKVAICEQISVEKHGSKEIVNRGVVRVITPGTVIDESMVQDTSNSYIMCIIKQGEEIGFAYADISTGEFGVGKSNKNALNYINDQIVCFSPTEIICNEQMLNACATLPVVQKGDCPKFYQYYEWAFGAENAKNNILDHYNLSSLSGYDFDDQICIKAIGALLEYLKETQKRDLKHLNMPRLLVDDQYMYLDNNTRKNLELEQRMKDGNKVGSLLWVLDKTNTNAGARMLKSWVNKPLQNLEEINKRLDIVEYLVQNPSLRASLIKQLEQVKDIERYVARLAYNIINPREFIALASSIWPTIDIKNMLVNCQNANLKALGNNIKDLTNISKAIEQIIAKDPPALYKDGNYIKDGYNTELDRLRHFNSNSKDDITEFERIERERTGIKNLKIGYNKVFGYYIEINKQYEAMVPFNYIRKQTISNNERYITEELKKYEEDVLSSHEKALKLEAELYENFKQSLIPHCGLMQTLANIISTIDCLVSLATVAVNNQYCRPKMVKGNTLKIDEGRHPVIELLQKKSAFISNDAYFDDKDNRTMILTGPNMAGKSTYMRQVALITLMAHIGSFVPADSAEICIVDRIFTRIGASDDLAVGQSTFMVEMVEVSNILRFATNRSLIILDEVGRGTSTHDGMSIASSVVEYLAKTLNCKTLFATHYHELMNLENTLDGVKNYCISIKEFNGELVFLRKIMRGSATRSYGIEVASLAGLPIQVINRAKEILKDLENGKSTQFSQDNAIIDTLTKIDINSISPMVAFDTLLHLINMTKE